MKTLLPLFAICFVLGCQSERPQADWTPPQFDRAQAGQIEIALYGEVKATGLHWVAEPATLASIEALAGEGKPNPAPRLVQVIRSTGGYRYNNNFVLVVSAMSAKEKETIVLQHGDILEYYRNQPAIYPH